jgi:AcrR family transcriptional regulator
MTTRSSGQSKSDRTRAAILASARQRFAQQGYHEASLRAIAADAGIDPAMIVRYFTNKDQLFAAAVDVDLRLPDLHDVPVRRRGAVLVAHFLDQWEGEDRNDVLPILIRSAVSYEVAASRARSILTGQLRRMIAATSGPDDATRRAGLVSSQLLGLAVTRYVIKLPGISEMNRDQVVHHVAPTIQRYLTASMD